MLARLAIAASLLLLLGSQSKADSDNLSDGLGPREVSIGETSRGDATGARAVTMNPAGLALSRQMVFEGFYGRRTIDAANAIGVSACDGTTAVPGCYYYRYFSADPEIGGQERSRRSHEAGIVLSRAITNTLAIGVNSRYYDYNSDLAGEEDVSGFGLDAGLAFRPSPRLGIGVVGHNLLRPESAQYPRAVGAGLAVRPFGTLTITGDGVWGIGDDDQMSDGNGRYGIGGEYFFSTQRGQAGYAIRGGGVFETADDTTYVTGGLGYANPKMAFDLAARRQVGGEGDDTVIVLGLRLFGPHVAARR